LNAIFAFLPHGVAVSVKLIWFRLLTQSLFQLLMCCN